MSEDLVKQTIIWVDSNEDLERVCVKWRDKSLIAVDTEFIRSQTYYPIPGLFQVNDGENSYLIDPQKITDFFPLLDVFDDSNIMVAIHSCSEDLEVFHHSIGSTPSAIFDTQIAAAMTGYGFSVGFANLVKMISGVELPKGETRSNWLQRPLSKAQVFYAALDVEYLFTIAEKLITELKQYNRLNWATKDSAFIQESFKSNLDPDRSYLRIKPAWKLSARQLAVLQNLSRWREKRAQDRDVPRNRILKDNILFTLAQLQPTQTSQLRQTEGLSERAITSHGSTILDLVKEAGNIPELELPDVLSRPLSSEENKKMKVLKEKVVVLAESLGVSSEILVRKKDYQYMVRSMSSPNSMPSLPSALIGWRKAVVGDLLLNEMRVMS